MSTFEEAIAAQHRRLHARLAAGMPRAGWKICVNDLRMQRKLGLDASFVGFLDGGRQLESGEIWHLEQGSVPGVEPEFAVRFSASVRPGAASDAIRAAIAGVAPAIEIVEWRGARFDVAALAESSSFHAGFVVGQLRPLADVPAIGEGCPLFRRGGDRIATPDASLVPTDLIELVAHVATFLDVFGEGIEAADWLLCGACTNPARVEAGDEIVADFFDARLGAPSFRNATLTVRVSLRSAAARSVRRRAPATREIFPDPWLVDRRCGPRRHNQRRRI